MLLLGRVAQEWCGRPKRQAGEFPAQKSGRTQSAFQRWAYTGRVMASVAAAASIGPSLVC